MRSFRVLLLLALGGVVASAHAFSIDLFSNGQNNLDPGLFAFGGSNQPTSNGMRAFGAPSSLMGFSGNLQALPEPVSLAVLGIGLAGLVRRRRR